ncbi:ABC-2 type transporter [Prevotella sp. DNF00663]|uniref:ABC transporter permease n=1 Tax=unclassified Prevotella TaxID=2638335 RepID=UPI0005131199|nr:MULTISPECIES: ABC transporter permease [unclassified Prevotella]KGI60619.1 membrane protein [Prevotella sp. S7 MS 2]KXB84678.1 ABC-2 type transporter [Prevotella sp. DNF00663]
MEKDSLIYKISHGLRDMCYICMRELRQTVTDEGVLIFFILVPLLYPLAYSWIYNNEVVREVPVAVVDFSHSHASREFTRLLDGTPDTKVAYHCNSLDEAKDLVGKQVVNGVIYFPKQFQNKLYRQEQTHVGVYCDMSLMLTYKAIYQSAQAVASQMNTKIQLSLSKNFTSRDEEVSSKPLDFDEVPIFNTTGGYGNFIIPGVLMLIIQQTLLLGIGLSAGTARETNRNHELVPISRYHAGIFRIVLGKFMCYFMIYMVLAAYLTLIVPRLFGFISLVYAYDLTMFMLPYLLSCIFFGMTMSCLVRLRENVMLLVVFTSVPFLFMSGVSWPQNDIPGVWQGIAWLFPSTFGIRGFVRMGSMGARLSDIHPEYIALWIQTLVYFFLTCIVYRNQMRRARASSSESPMMVDSSNSSEVAD